MPDYREYHAYQWNIGDIGEGYTDEDISQLQALIDEELERVADEALIRCAITVVGDDDYNSNYGIQFNTDEAIGQAVGAAYERFIALAGRYDASQNAETRTSIADALLAFGWTVADYGDDADHYAAHVREDDGDSEGPGSYVLSLTKEAMPPFDSVTFDTLDALSAYVAVHFPGARWREDGE